MPTDEFFGPGTADPDLTDAEVDASMREYELWLDAVLLELGEGVDDEIAPGDRGGGDGS